MTTLNFIPMQIMPYFSKRAVFATIQLYYNKLSLVLGVPVPLELSIVINMFIYCFVQKI